MRKMKIRVLDSAEVRWRGLHPRKPLAGREDGTEHFVRLDLGYKKKTSA